MKFNRKNIYLKPEIYIEEFDDADEGFMTASPVTGNGTHMDGSDDSETDDEKAKASMFQFDWSDSDYE